MADNGLQALDMLKYIASFLCQRLDGIFYGLSVVFAMFRTSKVAVRFKMLMWLGYLGSHRVLPCMAPLSVSSRYKKQGDNGKSKSRYHDGSIVSPGIVNKRCLLATLSGRDSAAIFRCQ
jgi:hypothetical protein